MGRAKYFRNDREQSAFRLCQCLYGWGYEDFDRYRAKMWNEFFDNRHPPALGAEWRFGWCRRGNIDDWTPGGWFDPATGERITKKGKK